MIYQFLSHLMPGSVLVLSLLLRLAPALDNPSPDGEIALQGEYIDGETQSIELYLQDVERRTRIHFDTVHEFGSEAGWSPRGRYVYVIDQLDAATRHLRLLDLEVGKSQVVTEQLNPSRCVIPLWWSPDERFLAFKERSAEGLLLLQVLDTATSEIDEIPGPGKYYGDGVKIDWSPDGRFVVLSNVDLSNDLIAYTVVVWDTLARRTLDFGDVQLSDRFAWSPDGRYLAITNFMGNFPQGDVLVYDTREGTLEDVLPESQNEILWVWAEDTNRLALLRQDADTKGVYWYEADDGLVHQTMQAPAVPLGWSPDGSRLILLIRDEEQTWVGIWDTEAEEMRYEHVFDFVANSQERFWSVDGQYLLLIFSGYEGNVFRREMPVIDVLAGSLQAEIDSDNFILRPTWSPKGHSLAYITYLIGSDVVLSNGDLKVMDAANGEVRLAAEHVRIYEPPYEWSASGRYLSFENTQGLVLYDAQTDTLHELGAAEVLRQDETSFYYSRRDQNNSVEAFRFDLNTQMSEAIELDDSPTLTLEGVLRSEGGSLGMSHCGEG